MFLDDIKRLNSRIRLLSMEIEVLNAKAVNLHVPLSELNVKRPPSEGFTRYINDKLDLERQREETKQQREQLINRLKETLTDIDEYEVIYMYYVLELPLSEVARRKYYSRQWVNVLRFRAYQRLRDKYGDD